MTSATSRITDLSHLPVLLTIEEMATIYRMAKSTIRRNLQLRKFRVEPYSGPPYRWLRSDVERDLQPRSAAAAKRRPKRRARATT